MPQSPLLTYDMWHFGLSKDKDSDFGEDDSSGVRMQPDHFPNVARPGGGYHKDTIVNSEKPAVFCNKCDDEMVDGSCVRCDWGEKNRAVPMTNYPLDPFEDDKAGIRAASWHFGMPVPLEIWNKEITSSDLNLENLKNKPNVIEKIIDILNNNKKTTGWNLATELGHFDGNDWLSDREIGEILGVPTNSVNTKFRRNPEYQRTREPSGAGQFKELSKEDGLKKWQEAYRSNPDKYGGFELIDFLDERPPADRGWGRARALVKCPTCKKENEVIANYPRCNNPECSSNPGYVFFTEDQKNWLLESIQKQIKELGNSAYLPKEIVKNFQKQWKRPISYKSMQKFIEDWQKQGELPEKLTVAQYWEINNLLKDIDAIKELAADGHKSKTIATSLNNRHGNGYTSPDIVQTFINSYNDDPRNQGDQITFGDITKMPPNDLNYDRASEMVEEFQTEENKIFVNFILNELSKESDLGKQIQESLDSVNTFQKLFPTIVNQASQNLGIDLTNAKLNFRSIWDSLTKALGFTDDYIVYVITSGEGIKTGISSRSMLARQTDYEKQNKQKRFQKNPDWQWQFGEKSDIPVEDITGQGAFPFTLQYPSEIEVNKPYKKDRRVIRSSDESIYYVSPPMNEKMARWIENRMINWFRDDCQLGDAVGHSRVQHMTETIPMNNGLGITPELIAQFIQIMAVNGGRVPDIGLEGGKTLKSKFGITDENFAKMFSGEFGKELGLVNDDQESASLNVPTEQNQQQAYPNQMMLRPVENETMPAIDLSVDPQQVTPDRVQVGEDLQQGEPTPEELLAIQKQERSNNWTGF